MSISTATAADAQPVATEPDGSAVDAGPVIHLHAMKPRVEVRPERVYFPFESGRLGYDCRTCRAKCCRGFGYLAATDTEFLPQLVEHPTLGFFASAHDRAPGVQSVTNCAPACFFLTEDGLCETHRKHGYAAKPETCRLFPFNSFTLVDDVLVVAPHSTLCPLSVLAREGTSELSSHVRLVEELALVGVSGPVRLGTACHPNVRALLELERRIVREAAVAAARQPYWRFAARTLELTHEVFGRQNDSSTESSIVAMMRFEQVCSEVLGLVFEAECEGTEIDDLLVALTPYLRSVIVFREFQKSVAMERHPIDITRVPYAIAVLGLIVGMARSAGMREITFQTVTQLQARFGEIIFLLSDAERAMTWHPAAQIKLPSPIDANARAFVRVAKDLLPSAQRQRPTSLGGVLQRHSSAGVMERASYLRFVAKRVVGRLMPSGATGFPRGLRLGQRLQRWGLRIFDEDTLCAAARFSRGRGAVSHQR